MDRKERVATVFLMGAEQKAIGARLVTLAERYFPGLPTDRAADPTILCYDTGEVKLDVSCFKNGRAQDALGAQLLALIVGAGMAKHAKSLSATPEMHGARAFFGSVDDLRLCLNALATTREEQLDVSATLAR